MPTDMHSLAASLLGMPAPSGSLAVVAGRAKLSLGTVLQECEWNELKNLGMANGWNGVPDELCRCYESHHTIRAMSTGRGCTRYWCRACRITWEEDASD